MESHNLTCAIGRGTAMRTNDILAMIIAVWVIVLAIFTVALFAQN